MTRPCAKGSHRVIERGWFILGPELEAFEREFAVACGTTHAVGVGTGTDALALVLRALGIGPGDEVITSPLSAAFSGLAIAMAGATPVFADLDPARLTLDPARNRGRDHLPDRRDHARAHLRTARRHAGVSGDRVHDADWRSSKTRARRTARPAPDGRSARLAPRARSASIRRRISARSATPAPSRPTTRRWPSG